MLFSSHDLIFNERVIGRANTIYFNQSKYFLYKIGVGITGMANKVIHFCTLMEDFFVLVDGMNTLVSLMFGRIEATLCKMRFVHKYIINL